MKHDRIGVCLEVLDIILTYVGWVFILLGLVFFSLPER